MSGQLTDDIIHEIFENIFSIVDNQIEENYPLVVPNDSAIYKLYKELNNPTWHDYYQENPLQIFQETFSSLFNILKIDLPSKFDDPTVIKEWMSKLKEIEGNISKKKDKEITELSAKIQLPYTLKLRCLIISLLSLVHYKFTVMELINLAQQNDASAAIKLISLDLSFLGAGYIQKIIIDAELTNNQDIKKKLSKAIISKKKSLSTKTARDHFALILLASLGYLDRSYPDWAEFLSHHNFDNFADYRNVASTCKRIGIPKIHALSSKNLDKNNSKNV